MDPDLRPPLPEALLNHVRDTDRYLPYPVHTVFRQLIGKSHLPRISMFSFECKDTIPLPHVANVNVAFP